MTSSIKDNLYLAERLYEYADWLEVMGDNPYKTRAFRRAAHFIQKQPENLITLAKQGFDLTTLPTIGKGVAYTIQTIIETGHVPEIKTPLKKEMPRKKPNAFLRLYHSLNIVKIMQSKVIALAEVQCLSCCGDYRRKQEIVERLVLIIQCTDTHAVFEQFSIMPFVKYLLSQEGNHLKVRLSTGIDMDIYSIDKAALGSALIFYTGSQAHIQRLMTIALQKGWLLNEKGLFKDTTYLAGEDERHIYEKLGLTFIPPELREDRGEIEAAIAQSLPNLITLEDIKGDLHAHTYATDGQESIETMANAAGEKGYEYMAITDHSKSLTITHGLDEKRLLQQIKQIDQLNTRSNHILILKSIEVDILEDGSLDLSNDVLKELDMVVCSIHSKFRLEASKQTARILRAMDNPYFNILGHATGRLIRSRPPYAIDMDRILEAAKERNCFIELNAQPYRLDINDIYCKTAKEKGVKVAISSDAHTTRGFSFMQLGIYQARRGWLEKDDVINTVLGPI